MLSYDMKMLHSHSIFDLGTGIGPKRWYQDHPRANPMFKIKNRLTV